jgi:glutamate dehydrogenase (NAD(P)+)
MDFSINDYSLLDEIGPEKIIILKNPLTDLNAVLVIDNSSYGIPAGGVSRMKVGGAKSGIWGDPLDKEKKEILITSFAKSIESFIKNDIYYPGPDMGTNGNDLLKMFSVMGVPNKAPKKIGLVKLGVPVEELFTGYGVVYCKVILEGFGKVGTALAMSLNELGFILTGVSTINGAIFDENGLNIDELLKLKLEYGDDLISHYHSKNLIKIPKERLFELSLDYHTDFIIPGARPDAINQKNIDKINAVALVPAANIPYAEGMINVLKEKGIIAFPEFVANAGEILAILVNKVAKSAEEIFEFVKSKITKKTSEVIQGATENKVTLYDYAVADALNELKKKLRRKKNLLEKLNKRY